MDKYKIIALFGKAGSGKDFLLDELIKKDIHYNFHRIIPYTTRPPREGEKGNYIFIKTPEELVKENPIEYTIFRDWWYGTPLKALNKNKINIGIFNIKAINQLINKDYLHRVECLPILINCSDTTRLLRQLSREENPNCSEICRRFLADQNDFTQELPFFYETVSNDLNDSVLDTINSIYDLAIKNF